MLNYILQDEQFSSDNISIHTCCTMNLFHDLLKVFGSLLIFFIAIILISTCSFQFNFNIFKILKKLIEYHYHYFYVFSEFSYCFLYWKDNFFVKILNWSYLLFMLLNFFIILINLLLYDFGTNPIFGFEPLHEFSNPPLRFIFFLHFFFIFFQISH